MASCNKLINQAINASCSPVNLIPGLEDVAVLINRDDIDWSQIDLSVIPHGPLASIPLLAGKKGYMVKQINDSFKGTKSELVKSRYRSKRKNTFSFVVFDDLGQPTAGVTGIATVTLNNGGNGYAVGDIINVVQAGITNFATIKVTAVNAGVVTAWSYINAGSGYGVGASTTAAFTGTGSGLTFSAATLKAATLPQSTDALLNQLDNGKFVSVYRKKTQNAGGDIEFKVSGLYRGLQAVKSTIDYYDDETAGAVPYDLETEEPEAPVAFYSTSKTVTLAAFNALCDMY